jgi:glyoxylase-like metal-dependent hydrolase (beta-lactamase superfamily II)
MAWRELGNPKWTFEKGLHDLGGGTWAWLQPDGSWGWSNAGLIVDGEQSLLVDTLFDLPLTREMLAAMRDAAPAAREIDTLVNTHANGDHCYGNELVAGAEIVASTACAEEMGDTPPAALAQLVATIGAQDSALGRWTRESFGQFEFEGITLTPPTRVFDGQLDLKVGDKHVELIEVGPAHTRGDVLVHVPGERVVYTGDILFIEGTPIVWEGPFSNWIDACDRIVALGAETIVPGHGPITDARGAEAVKAYLEFVRDAARERFDGGLSAADAARDIPLGEFSGWSDAERLAVNVDTAYREFGSPGERDLVGLFGLMGELSSARG